MTDGSRSVPQAELAEQLGITKGAVLVAIHHLRYRYRDLVRETIALTVNNPVEIRERQSVEAITRFGDAIVNEPVLKNSPTLNDLCRRLLNEPIAYFNTLRDQLQTDAGTRPESLEALSAAVYQHGFLSQAIGDRKDARKSFTEGLPILERLVCDHPNVAAYQLDQAKIHGNMGKILTGTGKSTEAEVFFTKASEIYESLVTNDPSTTEHQYGLAGSYLSLSQVAAITGRMREAEVNLVKARLIFERLVSDHPEASDFASELGATLHNLGEIQFDAKHFTQARDLLLKAIVWQRKALASNPGSPRYRECINAQLDILVRAASALDDKETVEAARQEMAQIAASDPRKAALDERLASIAKGAKPRDNAERLALAQRASETKYVTAAARPWIEAFNDDPKLATDRKAQHRYNAACAASLAASGQGKDNPSPDNAAKAKLRRQALDWLKAELSAWKRISMIVEPGNKKTVAKTLAHWKQDTDLISIRDEAELANLPKAERKEWLSLWADVDALLKKIEQQKP